jgi:hypothetical protein
MIGDYLSECHASGKRRQGDPRRVNARSVSFGFVRVCHGSNLN